jgi:hypothetical protein
MKLITEKLIEQTLEDWGFLTDVNDAIAQELVLNHYGAKLTSGWSDRACLYIHDETTADGHTVFVCTGDLNRISVNEDIFQYESSEMTDRLVDAIRDGAIVTCDLDTITYDAIETLYVDLLDEKREEAIESLLEQGYVKEITEVNSLFTYVLQLSQKVDNGIEGTEFVIYKDDANPFFLPMIKDLNLVNMFAKNYGIKITTVSPFTEIKVNKI